MVYPSVRQNFSVRTLTKNRFATSDGAVQRLSARNVSAAVDCRSGKTGARRVALVGSRKARIGKRLAGASKSSPPILGNRPTAQRVLPRPSTVLDGLYLVCGLGVASLQNAWATVRENTRLSNEALRAHLMRSHRNRSGCIEARMIGCEREGRRRELFIGT